MSDTPDPLVQQKIDEAAKLAGVLPSSETQSTDSLPPVQPPAPPPPEPVVPKIDNVMQPEVPDQLNNTNEEIVIKSGEPAPDSSIQKNENPQQNHHRPRVSPTVLLSLLLLIITLPLGALYISQQKQLTDVRTRAASPIPKPTLLQDKPAVATPSSKPANVLAYERLNKTYFGQYVNDLSVLKARVWNVFVADRLIHGTVFLKYDDTVDKTFIFSRLQGLVPVTKKAFHLWLVNNDRFSKAGVIDVADEDGVSTGYSSFEQIGDFRNYEQLVISHDASESAKPQSIITTLEISNSKL